jgi:putative Ca2+/H+ antiporter (TMEM165/GDT1 family)
MAAIIPISLLNALVFFKFSHRFDLRKAHYGSALLFGFFGLGTLKALLTGGSVWEWIVTSVGTALFIG